MRTVLLAGLASLAALAALALPAAAQEPQPSPAEQGEASLVPS
jgi:hypothetical protein